LQSFLKDALQNVEDEIEARRDQLIEALERRMKRETRVHHLFRIRWRLE